jgi:hypothetical protein
MSITGPVQHPKHMPRLGNVTEKWIQTLRMAIVRVIATRGPFHLVAARKHGAVKVERDSSEVQRLKLYPNDLAIERHQALKSIIGKLTEPPTRAAVRRQSIAKPANSLHERIFGNKRYMPKSAATRQPQRNKHHDEVSNRVVTLEVMPLKRAPDAGVEVNQRKVPAKKLKPRKAREILFGKLNFQIGVDSAGKILFS